MGVSRGISSFVDGAIKGQLLRREWADRKRDQEWEDEERVRTRQEWTQADEDRKREREAADEDRAWTKQQRSVTKAEQDRAIARRDEEEGLFKDVLADTLEPEGESGTKPAEIHTLDDDTTAKKPKKKAKPSTGRNTGRSLSVKRPPRSGGPTPSLGVDPVPDPATVPQPGQPQYPQRGLIAQASPQAPQPLAPVIPGYQGGLPAPGVPATPPAGPLAPLSMDRSGGMPIPTDAPGQPPVAAPVAPAPNMVQPSGPPPDPYTMAGHVRAAPADAPTPITDAPGGPVQAAGIPGAPAVRAGLSLPPQAAPAGPQVAAADLAPPATAPAALPPTAQAAASPLPPAAAAAAAPVAAAPSVQIATDTAATPRGRSVTHPDDTPAARQASFMQRYREEAVPKIVQFYLGRGELEKAKGFETWAQSEETKEGMTAWSKGVHAAADGDEGGFIDSMVEAYNTTGYFDDGYQIVRGKSGFSKDEDGTVTGAFLTFKNQKTGETFTKTYDGMEDIYRMGIQFLSPEQVWEHGQAQIAAADAERAKEAEQERKIEIEVLKAGLKPGKNAKEMSQVIRDTIKVMAENDMAFAQLSPEEQVAQAVAQVRAVQAGAAELKRPQRVAPPVYRGD